MPLKAKLKALYLPAATLLVALGLSAGCSKNETPVEDAQVDLRNSVDVFDATGPVSETTVVVKVNGVPVLRRDVLREMEILRAQARAMPTPPPVDKLQAQAVDQAILKKVLLDTAEQRNFQASPEEVEEAMGRFVANLKSGVSQEEMLTVSGVSLADFRQGVVNEIIVRKLLESVADSVPDPTPEEVQSFYTTNEVRFMNVESVVARHIFFALPPTLSPSELEEKRTKAETCRQLLVEGEDFEQLALEYSEDKSRVQGGRLPTVLRGQYSAAFETVVFSLPTNTISEIVETPAGLHIIRVDTINPPTTITFEQAKARIAEGLRVDARNNAVREFIDALVKSSLVEKM